MVKFKHIHRDNGPEWDMSTAADDKEVGEGISKIFNEPSSVETDAGFDLVDDGIVDYSGRKTDEKVVGPFECCHCKQSAAAAEQLL